MVCQAPFAGDCSSAARGAARASASATARAAGAARGALRRSSLTEFLGLVQDASVQLVSNLNRSAELIQSFKQVALDQSQSHRRSFDPGELTEQMISHLAREMRVRGIALRLHCDRGLVMDSYPGPFAQVLTQLAVNAMTHAFPNGGGAIDISVSAAGPDQVGLTVADDGCGMAPEIKRQAFDPFFTTRRQYGATGLGLHIVHTIVTNGLGGRVNLDSEPDQGTKITIVLPRMAPKASPPS